MEDRILNELSEFGRVETGRLLSTMTTLRIGGPADYVVYPENDIGVDSLITFLQNEGIPYKLLGKGSDILCSDDPYHGVIIRLDKNYNDAFFKKNILTAQAGCSIIALANQCMKKGLSGLEFASGIPGTVGGAVFMNAGAYRSDMAAIVREVNIYHDHKVEWISNEQCEFRYRHSIFQRHPDWIILAVRMELTPADPKEIEALMADRRQRRFRSQPLNYPSCGSVFRNPEGRNAWELIDGVGYRGRSVGGAKVSEKHCNFIVNTGNATAKDYLALVEEIQNAVFEKYGISLRTEMEKFNWTF